MVVVLALVIALLVPGAAAAHDPVVVSGEHRVVSARVLAGTMLVERIAGRRGGDLRRVLAGHVLPARALQGETIAEIDPVGRDRAGRVVVPVLKGRRTSDGRLVRLRWWRYDVGRDVLRRVRGLPGGTCTPQHLALWRRSVAYVLDCPDRAGVYLRADGRTRRVSRHVTDFDDPLVLRGRTLVMVAGRADDLYSLWRLVEDGRVCPRLIEPSVAAPDHEFSVAGVWLTGRRLSWWMEHPVGSDDVPLAGNLVLGIRLGGGCAAPGPPGAYAPLDDRPLAVDGARLYHADGGTVRRRDVSAGPSTDPPPNDDFAGAAEVTGPLPVRFGARVGYGVRGPTDPPVTGPSGPGGVMSPATRTLWYAYRPTERAALLMEAGVDPEGILPLIRQGAVLHSGAVAFYEQDAAGNLRELPRSREDSGYGVFTTVAADPAHRYFIGLGCDTALPCWPTFGVRLERTG